MEVGKENEAGEGVRFLYIYIYIFIYICTYIYINIHILYTSTSISIYMYIYICTYIYVYIYVYVSIYLHLCIYKHRKGEGARERDSDPKRFSKQSEIWAPSALIRSAKKAFGEPATQARSHSNVNTFVPQNPQVNLRIVLTVNSSEAEPCNTLKYFFFIKSQLASRHQLKPLVWFTFGLVIFEHKYTGDIRLWVCVP